MKLPSTALLTAAALAVLAPAAVAAPPAGRLSLDHELVAGASEHLTGRILVAPTTLTRTGAASGRSLRYTAALAGTCRASVTVSARAVATSSGPTAQVRRSTAFAADGTLAGSTKAGRPFRIVEFTPTDQPGPQIYGISAVRLRTHRYVQVRLSARFAGDCPDRARHAATFVGALRGVLTGSTVQARIAPGRS